MWLPGENRGDAAATIATDIILLWLKGHGKGTDIRYIGRQTRNRLIDMIRRRTSRKWRTSQSVIIAIGDHGGLGSGDHQGEGSVTAEDILSWLHYHNSPSRTDLNIDPRDARQCSVCNTAFAGRVGAKFCSPKCRKRASRAKRSQLFAKRYTEERKK